MDDPLIGNSLSKPVPVWAFGGYQGNLGAKTLPKHVGIMTASPRLGNFLLRNHLNSWLVPKISCVLYFGLPYKVEMSEGYSPKWYKQHWIEEYPIIPWNTWNQHHTMLKHQAKQLGLSSQDIPSTPDSLRFILAKFMTIQKTYYNYTNLHS